MSAADFHQILGVSPNASAAEIKRAYKRLAMRWHPDRNPDPQAHVEFRRVREAFDRLTQAHAGMSGGSAAAPETRRSAPKGEEHRREVFVELHEAACGATVTITIEGRSECPECQGSGQRSYRRTTMCAGCYGSGRVRGAEGLKTCTACHGKGFLTDTSCPDCSGHGWLPAERQLAINVPPGMLPGEELRVAGQGGAAPADGEPGDLYLILRAKPHPLFRLEGHNLHVTVPVSIFRVLAGGLIEVPTLEGVREVLLSEASAGTEIRVPGAGFPGRGRRPAGDLLVHLETHYPRFLCKEQKAMLEMAEELLAQQLDAQSPALANWSAALAAYR